MIPPESVECHKTKKIGILTGGGDCPGLNAVIRGVVKSAIIRRDWKVIGIHFQKKCYHSTPPKGV